MSMPGGNYCYLTASNCSQIVGSVLNSSFIKFSFISLCFYKIFTLLEVKL